MKTAFLSALIFSQCAVFVSEGASRRETVVLREVGYVLPASVKTVSRTQACLLPPVAERASRQRLSRPVYPVSGSIPRAAYTGQPAMMVSPFAPPEYGSGTISYVEREPYRTDNPNKTRFQPNGLNLLNIREIW